MGFLNKEEKIALDLLDKLDPYHPQAVSYLASDVQTTPKFAQKVLNKLRKAGYVSSTRGLHGGFKRNHFTLIDASVADVVALFRNLDRASIGKYSEYVEDTLLDSLINMKLSDYLQIGLKT